MKRAMAICVAGLLTTGSAAAADLMQVYRDALANDARYAAARAELEAGVLRACHKRPISAEQITKLVDSVETEVYNRGEREIPSTVIGELVIERIRDLDPVAYVRFASVYREFKDVNTFMDELKKFLQ